MRQTTGWVDKEKDLAWFSSASQPVQQEITKQDLNSAAKVVEDFDNRKYFGKNLLDVVENNVGRRPKKVRRITPKKNRESPQIVSHWLRWDCYRNRKTALQEPESTLKGGFWPS